MDQLRKLRKHIVLEKNDPGFWEIYFYNSIAVFLVKKVESVRSSSQKLDFWSIKNERG